MFNRVREGSSQKFCINRENILLREKKVVNVDISDDHRFLVLTGLTDYELRTLNTFFTKDLKDAYILKKKFPNMPYQISFLNEFGMLLIGLWMELIKACRKFNFRLSFKPGIDRYFYEKTFNENAFKDYAVNLFKDAKDETGKPVKPKNYQIDAACLLAKYHHGAIEITTSGGKTLMSYILFRYLLDNKRTKRFLYIVPSRSLATQSADAFDRYEKWINGKHTWSSSILNSTASHSRKSISARKTSTILFSTYQSLARKPLSFFKDFSVVILDECHHVVAPSLRRIIRKCMKADYILGMTGTFPKDTTCDCFVIESYIGPLIYRLSAYDLIHKIKFACPVIVIEVILDWATEKEKQALYLTRKTKPSDDGNAGMRLLKTEQEFVNKNPMRLEYIARKAIAMKKNTLILFGDVHIGKYGKKIYEYIKENSTKNVYYSDGDTPEKNRRYFNQMLENDTDGNTIIVASIYTYGEGIDLHNLYSIFLVNTLKSEKQIRQILGRGMRNYTNPVSGEKKENVVLFDFIDDLKYKEKNDPSWLSENYIWKHFVDRNKIYTEQKFPVYKKSVNFHQPTGKSNMLF